MRWLIKQINIKFSECLFSGEFTRKLGGTTRPKNYELSREMISGNSKQSKVFLYNQTTSLVIVIERKKTFIQNFEGFIQLITISPFHIFWRFTLFLVYLFESVTCFVNLYGVILSKCPNHFLLLLFYF